MIWLAAVVLCALVDQAAFYEEADDDFDEAYDEEDDFTSPVTVSKDCARRKRNDVTSFLHQLDTTARRDEYEGTDADNGELKSFLPLTMLPACLHCHTPKRSFNEYIGSLQKRFAKLNNIIEPNFLKTIANLKTDFTPANSPTRSKLKPAYSESLRSGSPTNDITAYQDLLKEPSTPNTEHAADLGAPKTHIERNHDLTLYPDFPAGPANTNTASTLMLPTRTLTANTDTTTDTVSTISTLPTTEDVTVIVSTSISLLSPGFSKTPFAYQTECKNCRNKSLGGLRVYHPPTKQPPPPPQPPQEVAPQAVDIPMLIKLISNLTMQYDWNLTDRFNESLQRYDIPTCPGLTTPTPTPYDLENAPVMAKCFVCGLTAPGVPWDSHCADAFSGDFIPLVPIDAQARGHIARFRKYCRFLDVKGVVDSPFEPHSMFGRFDRGCSVRWVDLTGIYTQRSCRNRRRAVLGKHFASKRMAKLEMALKDLENGCIISPVASLLPVSRGISLYARFHACVCTGSWCNRAAPIATWTTNLTILFMLAILKILS